MGLLLGQVSKWRAQRADGGAHAARGFVSGAAQDVFVVGQKRYEFQCRTRLCEWCSRLFVEFKDGVCYVSMPHAAL